MSILLIANVRLQYSYTLFNDSIKSVLNKVNSIEFTYSSAFILSI